MPWHERSSSEKRRGPSERSWTSTAVHFAPMISAQQATEQVSSWIAFIVRTATRIVMNASRALAKRQTRRNTVIDLHSHILPGLDDGAETLDQSLAIARAAVEDGIAVIAATPHVRDDYPTTAAEMEERLAEVRRAVEAENIPLDVRPGGEIALDRLARVPPDDLRRFGLGGNPRC